MDTLVMALEAVRYSDRSLVGGKAALLGTLRDAGFPVPPGLCITTAAFSHTIAPLLPQIQLLLATADLHDPAGIAAASDAVQRLLIDLTVPEALVGAVTAALREHGNTWSLMAVRSSATDEDQATASFAGHYATVLGVPSGDALWTAAQSLAYRQP